MSVFSKCLKLKPQCLLQPSLAAGLLQSFEGFSELPFLKSGCSR